jgi:hypothetical protein
MFIIPINLYSLDHLLYPVEDHPVFSTQVKSKLQKIEENFNPKRITILQINEYASFEKAVINISK